VILAVVALAAQTIPPPPPGYVLDRPPVERLGPGPHTLVISDGNAMTRIDYKSGVACQRARDKVRLQTDSRLTNTNPYVIYGTPKVSAFCVPR
jgi:hypothetical protein